MEYIGGGKWEDTGNIHGHKSLRHERPVAEKKVIKTVATVAAVAAVAYYGGSALMASGGAAAGTGAAASTGIGGAIKGILASPYLTAGALAMQGISMVQQANAAGKMQAAEQERQAAAEKLQASQERQSQVEATRARMAAVREQRILQGRLVASTGASGMTFGGTSGAVGSTSALGTQLGTAIGNVNVSQGFAAEQGAANLDYGRATSNIYQASNEAAGWQQVSALGKELRSGESMATSFEKVGTIFSTKA